MAANRSDGHATEFVNTKVEENSHNPAAWRFKHVVDIYYMYRLAATRMPQSLQGTSEVWHPRVDYELLL